MDYFPKKHMDSPQYPVKISYSWRSRGISMRATKSGEIHVTASPLVSKAMIREFIDSHSEWIEKALGKTADARAREEAFFERLPLQTREERAEAKARMDSIIRPLVEKYAPQMGVSPSAVSYRASRSRWGSCNPSTRRINFSYYLLLLPDICIEHVVVHELAHLLVSGHGPAFYKVMDRYFPRWKEARALARRTVRSA